MTNHINSDHKKPRLIIVGAGFGGLTAAQSLKQADMDVILIDRTNHHLFQPLLYQVATASLAPGDIAMPVRAIFRNQENISVILGEVTAVDKDRQVVTLDHKEELDYDYLLIATGTHHSYFGHNEWEEHAPGLKTLSDALKIREKILLALEKAEREPNPQKRKESLHFIIVGGGPTGVELAGSISEIVKRAVIRDYRNISKDGTSITILEGLPYILPGFDESLRDNATRMLKKMDINVKVNTMVTEVTDQGVNTKDGFIKSGNVIWAAGNEASSLIKRLDLEAGRAGRIPVEQDMSVKGYPNMFIIGDAAIYTTEEGRELPALAPVAIQQGRHVARLLSENFAPGDRPAFRYRDKGQMATIGRAKGVAQIGSFKFSGFMGWMLWSVVHIFFLIGFRNRFRVMAEWVWYYLTFRGSFRLITGLPADASKHREEAVKTKE
ncbi:MAG: NAD(P)/FAD-dependent oxidoreductase [Balneolales bacterium]